MASAWIVPSSFAAALRAASSLISSAVYLLFFIFVFRRLGLLGLAHYGDRLHPTCAHVNSISHLFFTPRKLRQNKRLERMRRSAVTSRLHPITIGALRLIAHPQRSARSLAWAFRWSKLYPTLYPAAHLLASRS